MSFQAELDNRTPFEAEVLPLPDGEGGELILIVAKASFDFALDGTLALASKPTPVRMADEFRGEPGQSSVRFEHDLAARKPLVDVLVEGCAHAPYGKAAAQVEVELRVGSVLEKRLLVTGDRRWEGDQIGAPEPFLTMPLAWERAYGGCVTLPKDELGEAKVVAELRNPVGVGYRGASSADAEITSELPNLEDPRHPLTRRLAPGEDDPPPVGLGPVGRGWQPRLPLAGTYDGSWKARRWPLRPRDYDPRWEQAAPADQQLEAYPGGAEVRLSNMSAGGIWIFELPHLDVPVHLFYDEIGDLLGARRCERGSLRVDTVEIDAEARKLWLTARLTVAVDRRRSPLRDVVLGHLTPAWLRAKRYGKCYLDRDGSRGTDPARPCFWT